MRFWLIALLSFIVLTGCDTRRTEVSSPDGRIHLALTCDTTGVYYSVTVAGDTLLRPSRMGFRARNGLDLGGDFTVTDVVHSRKDDTWTQPWGENKEIRDHHREMAVCMENGAGVSLTVRFRVFNDGLGFSYEYDTPSDSVFIMDELTRFNFARNGKSWTIPASFETYELLYRQRPITGTGTANTPATFRTDNGLYVSIHEAALTDFPEMTLARDRGTDFRVMLAPWPDGVKARMGGRFTTPWRTVQISDRAVGLINSPLILNLNEPCALEDTGWIKPVKYVGVWWGMHLGVQSWVMGDRHGATTENAKRHIDFAADNNIEAVLFEGWNEGWDTWGDEQLFNYTKPYEDFDLDEVVRYAKQRGVMIIGHHETGANMPYYESQMEDAFRWYADRGVHLLKTGYAGGIPEGYFIHSQYAVRHYRKVVETAAAYEIALDVHEPIKPTGTRRTYPNMMTREGVRGMEWNAWSEGNPPEHQVTLPFTRMLAGPVDYTPGIFDILYDNTRNSPDRRRWNDNDRGNSRVNTTLAKQIALWVILYSPMQMAPDLIEHYEGHPAFQFFRDFDPDCDWSEALDGEPGEFVAIVRRAGEKFFLGAATNQEERSITVPLDFLGRGKSYKAVIYADGPGAHWETNPLEYSITEKSVDRNGSLEIKMAPGGGAAVTFIPEAAP